MVSTTVYQNPRAGVAASCADDCPLVYLCRKCKHHDAVAGYLSEHTRAKIETVRCQKVCESPVAGLRIKGRMEWFERVDGPKALRALASLASGLEPYRLPKSLRKRRSKKRSGRPPR